MFGVLIDEFELRREKGALTCSLYFWMEEKIRAENFSELANDFMSDNNDSLLKKVANVFASTFIFEFSNCWNTGNVKSFHLHPISFHQWQIR